MSRGQSNFDPGFFIMTLENIEQIEVRQGRARTWYRPVSNKAVIAFAGVLSAFAGLQFAIWHINGFWLDEIYSLIASDPSHSFGDDFVRRMASDTMPPGFYSLLYFARIFVKDSRIAVMIVNCAILALAAVVVVISARRARVIPLALLCISAFIMSSPVIYYTPEARSYLLAFALTFVISWRVSLQLTEKDSRPFALGYAALGLLAALTHIYASLYCCCVAAGMIAVAMKYPRRPFLFRDAIVLALSAGLSSCLWLIAVRHSLNRVDWLNMFFNVRWVLNSFGLVFMLAGGPVVIAMMIIFARLPVDRRIEARPLTLAFSIAYFLFFVVPILVSFKRPVIMGRYWLVGFPGIVVFVVFQLAVLFPELVGKDHPPGEFDRSRHTCAALAVLWMAISLGGVCLRFYDKTVWRGLGDVKPLIASCPEGSIHIGTGLIKKDKFYLSTARHFGLGIPQLFGALAEVSPDIFVPILGSDGPLLAAGDAKCPVLGWAEHLNADALKNFSDADLLRLLKIEASNKDLDIRRHRFGYVVLLRGRSG
jgi:hypothetical protein